jgi:hypothetical protein
LEDSFANHSVNEISIFTPHHPEHAITYPKFPSSHSQRLLPYTSQLSSRPTQAEYTYDASTRWLLPQQLTQSLLRYSGNRIIRVSKYNHNTTVGKVYLQIPTHTVEYKLHVGLEKGSHLFFLFVHTALYTTPRTATVVICEVPQFALCHCSPISCNHWRKNPAYPRSNKGFAAPYRSRLERKPAELPGVTRNSRFGSWNPQLSCRPLR